MHTPTPSWIYEYTDEDESRCGYIIRKKSTTMPLAFVPSANPSTQREVIAHTIVQSVNSHTALVEALEKIIAYRDRVGPLHFQLEKMDDLLHQGRKALELVKKGSCNG